MNIQSLPKVVSLSPVNPHSLVSTLLVSDIKEDGDFTDIDVTARLQLVTENSSVVYDFGVVGLLEGAEDVSLADGGVLQQIQMQRTEILTMGNYLLQFFQEAIDTLTCAEARVYEIIEEKTGTEEPEEEKKSA